MSDMLSDSLTDTWASNLSVVYDLVCQTRIADWSIGVVDILYSCTVLI